jgi:hypothetical protein
MGNNRTSFAIVFGGSGVGSIQAAQGQRRSIAAQGSGAQLAVLIERQRLTPPDGRGDDLDGVAIAESKAISGGGTGKMINRITT